MAVYQIPPRGDMHTTIEIIYPRRDGPHEKTRVNIDGHPLLGVQSARVQPDGDVLVTLSARRVTVSVEVPKRRRRTVKKTVKKRKKR